MRNVRFSSRIEPDLHTPKRIHFMGIGGSGISGIAMLAKQNGFVVDGCELETTTSYLSKIKKTEIEVYSHHDKSHVENSNLVVVSPAVLYINRKHPEVLEAQRLKKLMTWEEFLGKFLHKNKKVLCISGTHGKSTTTAILSKIFVNAKFDPMVTIGATIKEWDGNFRNGNGKYFITEADEFNNNFLHYNPDAIVLNNVEMDHADFFNNFKEVFESFSKFIQKLNGRKILIVNQDSVGVSKVLKLIPENIFKELNLYGYTFAPDPVIRLKKSVRIKIEKAGKDATKFSLVSSTFNLDRQYSLRIPGEFNVANATAAIIMSKIFDVPDSVIAKSISEFAGIGRRLELLGEVKNIKVYDDYAHHPTAIRCTIDALRQKFPNSCIWAIDEPHSYSRTYALINEYAGVFDKADKVIVTPIFKARDKGTFGITGTELVRRINHSDARFIDSFEKIVETIKKGAKKGDVVLVMGAGKSYQLSREILNSL